MSSNRAPGFSPFQPRHIRQLLLLLLLLHPLLTAQAIESINLVRHVDALWRGNTSHAMMSMQVKTRRYQRSMTLEAWSRGKAYSLILIRKPAKDKGIATLKVNNNIWNYLPRINRVTKVPASMMSGSWMGSHFSNDDLVKESTFEDDYESHITFSGMRNGKRVYELTATPKPDAAVVWGKVIMLIDQQYLFPRQAQYYDEDGSLIRTLYFDQVKKIGQRHIPMRLTLQPEDKPEESTVITYHSIAFDMPLPTSFFSIRNLRRRH